jgi:uncharacterized protein (TIGR03435 family)
MKKQAVAAILAFALTTQGQTRPQVEVAAIHPSPPGQGDKGLVHIAPGKFEAHNMTVRKLIYIAYKIKSSQILGGPAWLNSETFDITATAADMTGDNFPFTLQTLLEDRFKLKVHPETKEGNVYDLTIAKSGLKMQPTQPGACVPLNLSRNRAAQTPDQKSCGWQQSSSSLKGIGIFITDPPGVPRQGLIGQLSAITDKPVIDQTGLTGSYDVHLEWTPDDVSSNALNESAQPAPLTDTGPTEFTAVREQLGLELKPAKGPITFLVIDSVDRPSEN